MLIPGIQALRGLAAILVVITHVTLALHERVDPLIPVWDAGSFGVWLFFVISGFVMTTSTQGKRGLHAAIYFFKRRIQRIVPIYWITTALKILAVYIAPAATISSALDFNHIVASFFFIPSINIEGEIKPILPVGWTLNFEMFFYLIFGTSLIFSRPAALAFVALIIFAIASYIEDPSWSVPIRYYSSHLVLLFAWGMILGKAHLAGYRLTKLTSSLAIMGAILIFVAGPGDGIKIPLFIHVAPILLVVGIINMPFNFPKPVLFIGDAS